jgi:DNA polymerase
MDLKELERQAAECKLCELHKGQNQPVFAKGSNASRLIVCGMCPGPEENKVGIPFVGDAGKILDEILLGAFGNYSSSLDVYVTNLVKCFVPPGTPLQSHWMTSCLPYFIVQIKLINPRVIVALGKDVSNFLLNNTLPMKDMRGKLFDYMCDLKILSTYHPSYLARGGGIRHRHFQTVVDDFKQIYKYM